MVIKDRIRTDQESIISVLDTFVAIPLFKMRKVRLMHRTDTKYVFALKDLPEILSRLAGAYGVMEINQERTFPYTTTYLDTDDYLFYNQHMAGKLERYKIRYRKYESSCASYLEIKKKTNKNITEKVRIVNIFDPDGFDDRAACFINANSPYTSESLKAKLINRFTRTTLVNLETNERITFDFDISFSDMNGKKVGIPFISIAELKKEGFSNQSVFMKAVKDKGIRPTGFSKYCIGSHYLREMPRENLLKPKLLLIKKLENEYNEPVRV